MAISAELGEKLEAVANDLVALTVRRPSAPWMREASLVVTLVCICAALFAWVLLGR